MMSLFPPSLFFDLVDFTHIDLFDEEEPVWMALPKIHAYLLSLSLGKIQGKVESGAFLVNPEQISIGKGTIVEPGAYISGPCWIGENCQIRHGAYLRGDVIVDNDCVIGHATEVKNSLFFSEAHAGHFNYVGDSLLGKRVNLGAGTKLANLRFDRKEVIINWENQKVRTGLKKCGAILGDDAQTGCNAVTNPGTLIAKQMIVGPCEVAKGVLFPQPAFST